MQNEVAHTQNKGVQVYQEQAEDQVLRSDIIIPYVAIAQGMSEAVKERKVQMGDIYRTTNSEILGGPDKPLELIVLGKPKEDWVIEQKEGSRFVYRRSENRNANNERLEWNFWADIHGQEVPQGTPGSTEWRRVKRLLIFALIESDILAAEAEMKKLETGDLPDPSKALTPVAISFRSTSYNAGREISTFFAKAKSMKVPIWRYKLKLSCFLDKNDQGSFYVAKMDTNAPKPVTKDHVEMVQTWADMLSSAPQTFKVDESVESGFEGSTETQTRSASEVC